jgi:broad specificity phosphatase PhoE
MQVIYLIRHGETDFNRDGRIQGYTESSLSELGVEQARRVGERLRGLGIAHAYASPLRRAADTCRIALDGSVAWETREGLREVHLGVWEGVKASRLKQRYPGQVKLWFQRPSAVRIEGAETIRAFRARVTRTMDAIRAERPERVIAVFAHGGVICTYLTRILGMKLDDIWRFKIRNGSITRVLFPDDRARVDLLGDVAHLDGAIREVARPGFRLFP